MKSQRFEEYHKHGCHFFGNLAVVNYTEDMKQDPAWGTFNANLTYDYLGKARDQRTLWHSGRAAVNS